MVGLRTYQHLFLESGYRLTATSLRPIRGFSKERWNGRGNQAFYIKQRVDATVQEKV
jgi:ribosomal protein L5